MPFEFKEVDRVSNISKEDFLEKYYKPQIPVVIESLAQDWPAFKKWNFNYMKSLGGALKVPLFDSKPVAAKDGFNEPKQQLNLKEYIELLESKPTDLRIFGFNFLKKIPQLKNDFKFPDLGLSFMKGFPNIFFGGENTSVFMHYDIDLANILHFHFQGIKTCILVHPSETKYMYKVPFSTICREDIDFNDPDFEKYPLLKKLNPYKTALKHGEALYMPEGYWHYMTYVTPGFSMSLRSIAKRPRNFIQAIYNIFIMRNFDNLMRKIIGEKWIQYRNERALKS